MIFFLDESGTDQKESPYEVLAGVAVKEKDIWNLIQEIEGLELQHFGLNLHSVNVEFKGQNLLKKKRFDHAAQCPPIEQNQRRDITRQFLQRGYNAKQNKEEFKPKSEEFAAFGQACISFVHSILDAAKRHSCKVFASIIPRGAERPESETILRRDYKHLLHRFFWCIENEPHEQGILVFDEIERKESRRLITKLHSYCNETVAGYSLSNKIVPTPFFVNSEISPIIQISDICAYCINWGMRLNKIKMNEPARQELGALVGKINRMGWSQKKKDQTTTRVWTTFGIFYISDLVERQFTNKKAEGETESPPPKERQRVALRPKPSYGQLLLFDEPSIKNKSRYLEI